MFRGKVERKEFMNVKTEAQGLPTQTENVKTEAQGLPTQTENVKTEAQGLPTQTEKQLQQPKNLVRVQPKS